MGLTRGRWAMAVMRFIALILIVVGLMLLGADVVSMLERGGEPHLRSLFDVWSLFSATGVESGKQAIAGLPAPVSDGLMTILDFPAFAVFGAVGVSLAVLFRERDALAD